MKMTPPYGELVGTDVSRTDTPVFTGATQDFRGAPRIYSTPNRQYSSNQGRWLSPDPARSGWNMYAYSTNPMSENDPRGLGPCDISGGSYACDLGGGLSQTDNSLILYLGDAELTCPNNDCNAFGRYTGTTSTGGTYDLTLLAGVNGPVWINNINGKEEDPASVASEFGLLLPAQSPLSPVPSHTPTSQRDVPANNGNFSWWGAFAKNLFSWKNFTDEFKQGGCVGVFVDAASEGGILPDLPAGHGVEDAVTDASKMAAATYAVKQGLVVPLRSSVVRGILDLGETSASGLVLLDTYAKIGAGGKAEFNAIKNGDCH